MRVYLAGPIFGTSDNQANAWRQTVRDALSGRGFTFVDPMVRDYRGSEDANPRAIVDADLADIASCDVVFAFCWQPSVGTAMELRAAFAEMHTTTIVVAASPVSPWLRAHATHLCATLGDGIVTLARLSA